MNPQLIGNSLSRVSFFDDGIGGDSRNGRNVFNFSSYFYGYCQKEPKVKEFQELLGNLHHVYSIFRKEISNGTKCEMQIRSIDRCFFLNI